MSTPQPPYGSAPQPPYGTPSQPPAGYPVPAPYTAPVYPQFGHALAAPPPPRRPLLGIVALVLSLIATVGASAVGAVAAHRIGLGAGREIGLDPNAVAAGDLSFLSPVRDWVLIGELSFWVGTALGVWALVQGIIALVRNRGRGAAIAAVVVAAIGPVVWGLAVWVALSVGLEAGSSIGG